MVRHAQAISNWCRNPQRHTHAYAMLAHQHRPTTLNKPPTVALELHHQAVPSRVSSDYLNPAGDSVPVSWPNFAMSSQR